MNKIMQQLTGDHTTLKLFIFNQKKWYCIDSNDKKHHVLE